MLGVVIWSNPQERKAVIWCEDHGDLAYFNDESALMGEIDLDAGDLVDFEMTTERDLRRVHNPRLVSEHAYSGLDATLKDEAGDAGGTDHDAENCDDQAECQRDYLRPNPVPRSAQIIPISQGLGRERTPRSKASLEAV